MVYTGDRFSKYFLRNAGFQSLRNVIIMQSVFSSCASLFFNIICPGSLKHLTGKPMVPSVLAVDFSKIFFHISFCNFQSLAEPSGSRLTMKGQVRQPQRKRSTSQFKSQEPPATNESCKDKLNQTSNKCN